MWATENARAKRTNEDKILITRQKFKVQVIGIKLLKKSQAKKKTFMCETISCGEFRCLRHVG